MAEMGVRKMKDEKRLTPSTPGVEIKAARKPVSCSACVGQTSVVPLVASNDLMRPAVDLPIMPEGFVTDTRLMPPTCPHFTGSWI
jgi:hypothetical protein